MLRFFIILCCLVAGQAAADITSRDLREIAYQGDIDRMEQVFADLHAAQLAGDISPEDLRTLVEELAVSHPDIIEFVADWHEAHPQSPYANVVRSWQMHQMAFTLRGTMPARNTPELAMREFRSKLGSFRFMAYAAYQGAPDFIPAVDTIFVMQTVAPELEHDELDQIRSDILSLTGDLETLNRSLYSANPGWGGGGLHEIYEACAKHADKIRDVPNFDVEGCIIYAAQDMFISPEYQDWMFATLGHRQDSYLSHARVMRVLQWSDESWALALDQGLVPTKLEEHDFILDYWLETGNVSESNLHAFLRRMRRGGDNTRRMLAIGESLAQRAEERLKYDPLNVKWLDMAQIERDTELTTGSSVSVRYDGSDVAKRMRYVQAQPYHTQHWKDLVRAVETRAGDYFSGNPIRAADTVSVADDVYIKGLLINHYAPDLLDSFLRGKISRFRDYESRQENPDKKWSSVGLTQAEAITEVICPAIRLERLYEAQCGGRSNCGHTSDGTGNSQVLNRIYMYAARYEACEWEKEASVDALMYEDIPTVFDEAYVGIENRD